MIVLKCAHPHGSVGFHAELIEGIRATERKYLIKDGEVVLDGHDDLVLKHDAIILLSMPNALYRMLTPREQDEAAKAKRDASTVEESTPAKKVVGG